MTWNLDTEDDWEELRFINDCLDHVKFYASVVVLFLLALIL